MTVKSTFRVKNVNDKEVCLYDLETGLTVFIKNRSKQKYNKNITNKINKITSGDIINATLESQNNLKTEWIFDDIYY